MYASNKAAGADLVSCRIRGTLALEVEPRHVGRRQLECVTVGLVGALCGAVEALRTRDAASRGGSGVPTPSDASGLDEARVAALQRAVGSTTAGGSIISGFGQCWVPDATLQE